MKHLSVFHRTRTCLATPLAFFVASVVAAAGAEQPLRFRFDGGKPVVGEIGVSRDSVFDDERGFGYLSCAGGGARLFAVVLDEGNYNITVQFGASLHAGSTTVKAESRRLMVESVETAPGEFCERTFTVNLRTPRFADASVGEVRLNRREIGPPMHPDWDGRLTLEFNGANPAIKSVEIEPAVRPTTLFVAGDSTVTNQRNEPYAGWAQMLPCFFEPGVAVANYAESGLALRSFEYQRRLAKVLSEMAEGDYLFIQFGHNDQKDKRPGAGPFTTYSQKLREFIQAVRSKGGVPVLVTPMERLRMNEDGSQTPTLADYAEAVRQVGAEETVSVIDLNAMSLEFYAALGPQQATRAFAFYPANTFPGQTVALSDRSHHSAYGAYELARCVVEGVRRLEPSLAKHLRDDVPRFDPSVPDPPDDKVFPPSPILGLSERPAGD